MVMPRRDRTKPYLTRLEACVVKYLRDVGRPAPCREVALNCYTYPLRDDSIRHAVFHIRQRFGREVIETLFYGRDEEAWPTAYVLKENV